MLRVLNTGYAYAHPQGLEILRPEGTPFYVFVHYRTPAEVLLGGAWRPSRDLCVLFAPGMPQHYRSIGGDYVNDWVHFTDDGGFVQQISLPTGALFRPGNTACLGHIVQNLGQGLTADGPWRQEIPDAELRSLLYRRAAGAGQRAERPVPSRYAGALAALRGQLYSRPRPAVSVGQLAAEANLSASYFQALYRRQHGVSIGEDIIRGRLDRACYLLRNSDYPITDIAAMSGYQCDAHFNRQFKKWMGTSPGRYRQGQG